MQFNEDLDGYGCSSDREGKIPPSLLLNSQFLSVSSVSKLFQCMVIEVKISADHEQNE